MSQIASATGGKSYSAETASSVVDIYKTLGSSIGRTHKRIEISSWFAAGAAGFLLLAVGAGAALQARVP
jgi:Ca-activated chloride channel family protein